MKRFQKGEDGAASTVGCTGFNFRGDDVHSFGDCVLISAFDAADGDLMKKINHKEPGWNYIDMRMQKFSHQYLIKLGVSKCI